MAILVTGGAGFIGSNLVKELNRQGYLDIIIVDHLDNANKWKNLIGLKYINYFEKDVFLNHLNTNSLNISLIFHLGACSSTLETNMSYLVKNNFEYSKILAEYALNNKIKFIYASSAATYGSGEFGYSDELSLVENLKPLNAYGFSKQMFDLWLLRNGHFNKDTSQFVGLKYFNIYGPQEDHKGPMRSLVNKAFHEIISTNSLSLFKSYRDDYKDGEQKRDFLYVKDAVNMTASFMGNNCSGLFNIGSGKAQTWNKLAKAIFSALKLKESIHYIDMPDSFKNQYQYFTEASMEKFYLETKFSRSLFSLETAVDDYINQHLKHVI